MGLLLVPEWSSWRNKNRSHANDVYWKPWRDSSQISERKTPAKKWERLPCVFDILFSEYYYCLSLLINGTAKKFKLFSCHWTLLVSIVMTFLMWFCFEVLVCVFLIMLVYFLIILQNVIQNLHGWLTNIKLCVKTADS